MWTNWCHHDCWHRRMNHRCTSCHCIRLELNGIPCCIGSFCLVDLLRHFIIFHLSFTVLPVGVDTIKPSPWTDVMCLPSRNKSMLQRYGDGPRSMTTSFNTCIKWKTYTILPKQFTSSQTVKNAYQNVGGRLWTCCTVGRIISTDGSMG